MSVPHSAIVGQHLWPVAILSDLVDQSQSIAAAAEVLPWHLRKTTLRCRIDQHLHVVQPICALMTQPHSEI